MNHIAVLLAIIAALIAFVALPAGIATIRRHPERRLICRLTPLAALSFVLWLVLLIWASSDKRNDAVISRHVASLRQRRQLPLVIGAVAGLGLVITFASVLHR